MDELTANQRLWYVAKRVLASPLSLLLWTVGGVLSFSLLGYHGMALAAFAALMGIQAARLYATLHNEEALRRIFQERQQREDVLTEQQIEAKLDEMDFETRQRVRYILQLQREVISETRGEDVQSYARNDLEKIAAQLAPLIDRAVRLAVRKQQLTKYLHNVDERALRGYSNNLRQRIESTTDSVTKAQYEQALQAREAELQTYQAISQASDRIDSQLENVEATFASWKAKVIRIKTADMASASSVSEGLYEELGTLTRQIDLLDSSVSEALAGDEPAVQQQTV